MAPRWKPFLLTSLVFVFVALFIFNYKELLLQPKFGLHFSSHSDSGPPELAIRLRPEPHTARQRETIHLQWDITQDYRSPDGVKKLYYLINGELLLKAQIHKLTRFQEPFPVQQLWPAQEILL